MSETERSTAPENRREAARWLGIAEEDLDVAVAAAQLPRPGAAAYHVQQAAEKLVKALLVLRGEPFRRTHDLDALTSRLADLYPHVVPTLEAIRYLTVWGIAYRYPGLEDEPEPPPSAEELERTTALLQAFASEVRQLIAGAE